MILLKGSPTAVVNHSRTGSSPAIIQNPSASTSTRFEMCALFFICDNYIFVFRTNTYSERYRLRSADDHTLVDKLGPVTCDRKRPPVVAPVGSPANTTGIHQQSKHNSTSQEEIYF